MSKPMLPGQNSKYWGYDLNNYLLSLDRKISSLESFHSLQSTIVQNSGPGFLTGSWSYTAGETFVDTTLSGTIAYETYRDGNVNYVTKTLSNWKIEGFYITKYDDNGKLEYPSGAPLTSTSSETNKNFPYNCAFYAVYLFCEPEEDGSDTIIKTILCPNYIFRGDCIMIGSYEASRGIFTPRVQTSSKTLYQSGQDTIHSYATVTIRSGYLENWPDFSTKVKNDQDSYVDFFGKQYFFCTNGINPNAILNNYNSTTKGEASYDVKVGIFSSNEVFNIGSKSDRDLGCYYLAPSGNIYVQSHAKPTDWPTGKDYMLEATDPLTGKEGYVTGGLVYIGCVYCQSSGVYQWVSAKQNGVNPVILDVDNSNPHKILIENNQYWTGSNAYKIKLNKISNDHVAVHLTDYIKNPLNFIDAKIDFITPEFRIFNGNSIEGEVILNCFKDANNNQLGQLILAGDETSGIILQGGDAYSKITLRHLDEDKIIINSKSDGGTIILSDAPDNHGCVLSGDGDTFTIKCGQNQGGKFEVFEDSREDFQVSVEGKFKVKGNTTLTSGHVNIGTAINSNNFNVYNQSTFYGPITIWTHSTSPFTVNRDTILTKGFKTNSLGTYYFDSQGNILCNNIAFTSDIRLKTNLKPINSKVCHNAVQNLNVNTYTYIRNNYDTLGLIAQEIEEQLPEYAHLLVHENEDGEKMVSEHKLLFILWEALKQEIKERKGGK